METNVRTEKTINYVPMSKDDPKLAGLSDEHVAVLTAEAESYKAAAEKLGIKIGTFKSRLHRARALLTKRVF